jgi:ornithine cyclodeaminase/alanine dehydrogenase-like protein (mu-crystallin family)
MRLLRSDDVDALATVEVGLKAARETAELALRGTMKGGRLQVGKGDAEAWVRVLVGIVPDLDVIGYKEFHRVGKRVHYHVSLFRHEGGEPIGIVDGRRITSLRTASAAALAFQHAFGDSTLAKLAVIGSGEEAREGLRAVAGAVKVGDAAVFSPTAANREDLARWAREELGIEASPATSVAAAIEGADAAYVATAARAPVVTAADVGAMRFVGAVGATRPDHHELSGDVFGAASQVVVDCRDSLEEPGDAIDAVENFGWDPAPALLLGAWLQAPADGDGAGPVLFKSIGSVEQDLVLALELLRSGEERGVGEVIEPISSLRVMR